MVTPSINLIKGRKPHFFDHFVGWALTVGRIVVIAVEAIALAAFLYRFGLDKQLIDLHDKIASEQNIVKFLKKNEDTYRNFQSRLILSSNILAVQDQTIKSYKDITKLIPIEMNVQTLLFSEENMKIEATLQSVSSFTKFIDNLKKYPTVAGISIDRIENRTSTGTISITITATFKKPATQI
jgi:hypothetical protein